MHRANSKALKEVNASEDQEKHSEVASCRDGTLSYRDFERAEVWSPMAAEAMFP